MKMIIRVRLPRRAFKRNYKEPKTGYLIGRKYAVAWSQNQYYSDNFITI